MTPEIYWIPTIVGRLGIMARPRAGEWLRDEIDGWGSVGIESVVSLLEACEVHELELADEASCCQASGIEFISYPIRNRARGVAQSQYSIGAIVAVQPQLIANARDAHARQRLENDRGHLARDQHRKPALIITD